VLLAHSAATGLTVDPVQVAPIVLFGALYWRRTRRLAHGENAVAAWRQWCFYTGLGLLLVALVSPVDSLGEEDFFFMHMLQHVILGDLAALAIVAGLTGPVLRPVLAIRFFDRLRVLAHPLVALPVWAFNLYVWHLPFMYQAALHHDLVHALEHFCFFTFGALMWAPVLEVLPAPEWFGTGAKLGYIALVRMLETILANVFIWSDRPFYPWYVHTHDLWGISPVRDQNLAGVVMMAEGGIVTIVALCWLFLKLASEGELRQQLLESGLDPRAVRRAVRYGRAGTLTAGTSAHEAGG
jgi:cytochrome c oxidase assembly factor CtaG